MSSRFVDPKDLKTIALGDGDWVKVPARFSYKFVREYSEAEGEGLEKIAAFMLKMVKEWNLEFDGEVAPIDKEHIEMLDIESFEKIASEITSLIAFPKAESLQSNEQ